MEIVRDFKPFFISLVIVSTFAFIAAAHMPAHAATLVEKKSTHKAGCYNHWIIKQDSPEYAAYKNARLVEYEDILCDAGVKNSQDLKLFAAQILQENGALAENVIGDHGCSLGIPQYNACAHNGMSAKKFLKQHPEWLSYKYQLKWMSLAMMDKYNRFADSRRAIIAHNRPASAARNEDTPAGYYATIVKKSRMLTL